MGDEKRYPGDRIRLPQKNPDREAPRFASVGTIAGPGTITGDFEGEVSVAESPGPSTSTRRVWVLSTVSFYGFFDNPPGHLWTTKLFDDDFLAFELLVVLEEGPQFSHSVGR